MKPMMALCEVCGIESNTVQIGEIFRFQQDGFDADGKVLGRFMSTGVVPQFIERLKNQGIVIDFSMFE